MMNFSGISGRVCALVVESVNCVYYLTYIIYMNAYIIYVGILCYFNVKSSSSNVFRETTYKRINKWREISLYYTYASSQHVGTLCYSHQADVHSTKRTIYPIDHLLRLCGVLKQKWVPIIHEYDRWCGQTFRMGRDVYCTTV